MPGSVLRYRPLIIDAVSGHTSSPAAPSRVNSSAISMTAKPALPSWALIWAPVSFLAACTEEAGHGIRVHSLVFAKAENRVARVDSYRELFSAFRIPIFEVCKTEYIPRSLERSKTIWESGPSSFAARDYARIIDKAFLE